MLPAAPLSRVRVLRLHCRACGDPLSRALREVRAEHPPLFSYGERVPPARLAWARFATPPRGTIWRSFHPWRTEQGPTTFGWVDFGTAGEVALFHPRDVAGSALPLKHRPGCSGCCGPAPSSEGPNLGCNRCGSWVLAEVYGCEIPRFAAAWTSRVVLRPADDRLDRLEVDPSVLCGPRLLVCRRCGHPLSEPLSEIEAPEPPLVVRADECPVDDDAAPDETGIAARRPRRGTFWRSRARWDLGEGPCRLGGVELGRRAEVLLLPYEDLGGTALRFYRRFPTTGGDGPNVTCNSCSLSMLTAVLRPGDLDFVAAHLRDVELQPAPASPGRAS